MEITVKYYNLIAAATGKMSGKIAVPEAGRQGEGVTLKEILVFLTREYGAALAELVFRSRDELNPGLLILVDGQLITGEGGEVLNKVVPAGSEFYNGKGDKSLYLDIDPEVCTGCRLCEAFCSYRRDKAITMVEECLGRWGKVWPPGYIST